MLRPSDTANSEASRRQRNPDWSRDETILLMDLYLSAPRASKSHPLVLGLSALLRAAALKSGGRPLPSFRNPAGIAMRLRNFGRLDPSAQRGRDAGLRPGGAIDRQVWREFGQARDKLQAEVARIRRSMSSGEWQETPRSSRGPVPAFGKRMLESEDGATGVYLLLIDAPLNLLVPGAARGGNRSLVKFGRTANLERRVTELAAGLPACSAVQYVPIALRMFASAAEAHRFERHLLDLSDERGWSLGGEFALAPLAAAKAAMNGRAPDQV